MFDTVNIFQPAERVKSIDLLVETPCYLERVFSNLQGNVFTGHLGNYRVSISERGVYLKGSISAFANGSNLNILPRKMIKESIEQLSDRMHIQLMDAKVNRLDIASNLTMEHKPEAYFPHLGKKRYYEREVFPHTIYYHGQLITIAFYNKGIESKKYLPIESWNDNILRCELRLKKRPHKYLNLPEVTPALLCDESFNRRLIGEFKREYGSIPKLKNIHSFPSNILGPGEITPFFATQYINSIGGVNNALDYIDTLKFQLKEHKSRAKKYIKELCTNDRFTLEEPLIMELNKKMETMFQELLAA